MNGAASNVLMHIAPTLTRRPRSPRTKRAPTAIERQSVSPSGGGVGGGIRMVVSTNTTARKLAALIPNAHA